MRRGLRCLQRVPALKLQAESLVWLDFPGAQYLLYAAGTDVAFVDVQDLEDVRCLDEALDHVGLGVSGVERDRAAGEHKALNAVRCFSARSLSDTTALLAAGRGQTIELYLLTYEERSAAEKGQSVDQLTASIVAKIELEEDITAICVGGLGTQLAVCSSGSAKDSIAARLSLWDVGFGKDKAHTSVGHKEVASKFTFGAGLPATGLAGQYVCSESFPVSLHVLCQAQTARPQCYIAGLSERNGTFAAIEKLFSAGPTSSRSLPLPRSRYCHIFWPCGQGELRSMKLMHPQPISWLQWQPRRPRNISTHSTHGSSRALLLTVCVDGAVRVWLDCTSCRSKGSPSYSMALVSVIQQSMGGPNVMAMWPQCKGLPIWEHEGELILSVDRQGGCWFHVLEGLTLDSAQAWRAPSLRLVDWRRGGVSADLLEPGAMISCAGAFEACDVKAAAAAPEYGRIGILCMAQSGLLAFSCEVELRSEKDHDKGDWSSCSRFAVSCASTFAALQGHSSPILAVSVACCNGGSTADVQRATLRWLEDGRGVFAATLDADGNIFLWIKKKSGRIHIAGAVPRTHAYTSVLLLTPMLVLATFSGGCTLFSMRVSGHSLRSLQEVSENTLVAKGDMCVCAHSWTKAIVTCLDLERTRIILVNSSAEAVCAVGAEVSEGKLLVATVVQGETSDPSESLRPAAAEVFHLHQDQWGVVSIGDSNRLHVWRLCPASEGPDVAVASLSLQQVAALDVGGIEAGSVELLVCSESMSVYAFTYVDDQFIYVSEVDPVRGMYNNVAKLPHGEPVRQISWRRLLGKDVLLASSDSYVRLYTRGRTGADEVSNLQHWPCIVQLRGTGLNGTCRGAWTIHSDSLQMGSLLVTSGSSICLYTDELARAKALESGTRRKAKSLTHAALVEGGCLPGYHPFLLETAVREGHLEFARASFRKVAQCLERGSRSYSPLPVKKYIDKRIKETNQRAKPVSFAVFSDPMQDLVDEAKYHESVDVQGVLTLHESQAIEEVMTSRAVFDLDREEQMHLLQLLETLSEADVGRSGVPVALDYAGTRCRHASRSEALSSKRKTGTATPLLCSKHCTWALHSEAQENLLDACLAGEAMTWHILRALGIGLWLRSSTDLQKRIERLAKAQFLQRRDPHDCALMYMALNRKSVLLGLFKTVKDKKLVEFLARDFTKREHQAAAQKNAYVLMGQHRYELAAAFFLLGNSLEDAICVCYHNLKDPQLALVIARLVGGEAGEEKRRLLGTLLDEAKASGDMWQQSSLQWVLGEKQRAVDALVGREGPLDPEAIQLLHSIARKPDSPTLSPHVIRQLLWRATIAYRNLGLPAEALEIWTKDATDFCPCQDKVDVASNGNAYHPQGSYIAEDVMAITLEDLKIQWVQTCILEHLKGKPSELETAFEEFYSQYGVAVTNADKQMIMRFLQLQMDEDSEAIIDRKASSGEGKRLGNSDHGTWRPERAERDHEHLDNYGPDFQPLRPPEEIYLVQNDLIEAACVNSVNEDCVALATIRRGMIEGRPQHASQGASSPSMAKTSSWTDDTGSSIFSQLRSSMSLPFALPLGIGLSSIESAPTESSQRSVRLEDVFARSMASHPSLPLYLAGDNQGLVHLWQFGSSRSLCHKQPPFLRTQGLTACIKLRFGAYGSRFASAFHDGTIGLWCVDSGISTVDLAATDCRTLFGKSASDVVYPTGQGRATIVAAAGSTASNENIVFWDTLAPPRAARVAVIRGHEGGATSLCAMSESGILLSGGRGGDLCARDMRMSGGNADKSTIWRVPEAHGGGVVAVDTCPSLHGLLGSCGKDGDIKLWHAATGAMIQQLTAVHERRMFLSSRTSTLNQASINGITWTSKGLVSYGADGIVNLCQFTSGPLALNVRNVGRYS